LHKKTDIQSSLKQITLIVVGVLVISSLHTVAHDFEEHVSDANVQTVSVLNSDMYFK
jgi:hypothetical protein